LFELLACDENLARLIATGASEAVLIAASREAGTGMLLDDAAAKVFAGTIPATLCAATWTMFWETEVNGSAVAEVAATTGRSAGAVYVARCRVMYRLREQQPVEKKPRRIGSSRHRAGAIWEGVISNYSMVEGMRFKRGAFWAHVAQNDDRWIQYSAT
jgi:tRNA G26 N,N-dimethylase Trm1